MTRDQALRRLLRTRHRLHDRPMARLVKQRILALSKMGTPHCRRTQGMD